MSSFKDVDGAALISMQQNGTVTVLDVRTENEVAGGIIPGAQHFPLNTVPAKFEELDRAVPIVIYCQTGGRSAQASAFLASKGFTNIHNLQGGVNAWVNAGNSLVAKSE